MGGASKRSRGANSSRPAESRSVALRSRRDRATVWNRPWARWCSCQLAMDTCRAIRQLERVDPAGDVSPELEFRGGMPGDGRTGRRWNPAGAGSGCSCPGSPCWPTPVLCQAQGLQLASCTHQGTSMARSSGRHRDAAGRSGRRESRTRSCSRCPSAAGHERFGTRGAAGRCPLQSGWMEHGRERLWWRLCPRSR